MASKRPGSSRGVSYNELIVLHAIGAGCRYGLEIMNHTRLSSGTVYPILRRFEADGLVSSAKEDREEAFAAGRPARRLHELTESGASVLSSARDELLQHQREMGLADASGT